MINVYPKIRGAIIIIFERIHDRGAFKRDEQSVLSCITIYIRRNGKSNENADAQDHDLGWIVKLYPLVAMW